MMILDVVVLQCPPVTGNLIIFNNDDGYCFSALSGKYPQTRKQVSQPTVMRDGCSKWNYNADFTGVV